MDLSKGPAPIVIYVTVQPNKRNGLRKPYTSRIAGCRHESDIAGIIERDRKEMSNTFGGLIESPGTSGRSYRAFRAEWSELKI